MANCLSLGLVMPRSVASLAGAIHVPVIDHQALDEPHGGRSAAARTVNKRRVAAFRRDGIQKLIRGGKCQAWWN